MLSRDLINFYTNHKFTNTTKDSFIDLIVSYKDELINVIYPTSEYEGSYVNLILYKLTKRGKTICNNISFYDIKHFYNNRENIKGPILLDPECYTYLIKEYQLMIENIQKLIKEYK